MGGVLNNLEGHKADFWDTNVVLFLDPDAGYTGCSLYKNLPSWRERERNRSSRRRRERRRQ